MSVKAPIRKLNYFTHNALVQKETWPPERRPDQNGIAGSESGRRTVDRKAGHQQSSGRTKKKKQPEIVSFRGLASVALNLGTPCRTRAPKHTVGNGLSPINRNRYQKKRPQLLHCGPLPGKCVGELFQPRMRPIRADIPAPQPKNFARNRE
jgi:hypothetical protein